MARAPVQVAKQKSDASPPKETQTEKRQGSAEEVGAAEVGAGNSSRVHNCSHHSVASSRSPEVGVEEEGVVAAVAVEASFLFYFCWKTRFVGGNERGFTQTVQKGSE